MPDLGERVAVVEFQLNNLSSNFEAFIIAEQAAKKEILDEIRKLNTMIAWGKGGVVVITALGAALVWIYTQFRTAFGAIHFGT